jgi:hypothetical protein
MALHSHRNISHPRWTSGQQEVTAFGGRDEGDFWKAAITTETAPYVRPLPPGAPNPPTTPTLKYDWCVTADMKLKASGESVPNMTTTVQADEDNERSARIALERQLPNYEVVRWIGGRRGKC